MTKTQLVIEVETALGLYKKLAEAREKVERVEKAGRNTAQNYDYATAEDVAAAAEKVFQKVGLIAEFSVSETTDTTIPARSGSQGLMVKATCTLSLVDPDTGAVQRYGAIGYGADWPGDKAVYKAVTGARKYALIHLLGIELGDDPEAERVTDREQKGAGKELATDFYKRAEELGVEGRIRLTASNIVGKDIGDCSNKEKTIEALSKLTIAQMENLNGRLQRVADQKAAKQGGES